MNVEIVEYSFEKEHIENFENLIKRLYPENDCTSSYRQKVEFLLSQQNPYFSYASIKSFIAYREGVCVGHVSAVVDKRLSEVGLVGFFEAESYEVVELLLKKAKGWLVSQRIKEIRGPINLSIWHNYRFMNPVDYQLQFLLEPFNLPDYPEYFKKFGFKVSENYISGFREDFSSIINHTEPGYKKIKDLGFSIRSFDLENVENELMVLHRLALEVFRKSWSFVPLSFEEFVSLYRGAGEKMDSRYFHFVCKENQEIGFCFSFEDESFKEKTLVMKTIGVLPEFQKNSLGSALIYLQHKNAEEDGYKRIIYALMRQNNVASNINPYDAKVFRKYEAYSMLV